MAEIANVASGETIESAWGNAIRDRTIQRYTSTAERDSLNPGPVEGDLAYIENTDTIQFYDGSSWVDFITDDNFPPLPYLPLAGGNMTGILGLVDGAASAPGLKFAADNDVGLYRVGSNILGFATAGVARMTIEAGGAARFTDGSLAVPGISFINDADTGFFRESTGQVRISLNGNFGGLWHAGGFQLPDGSSPGSPPLAWANDPDTGLFRPLANNVAVAGAGVELARFGNGEITFPGRATTTNSGLSAWRNDGFPGSELLALSSSIRYKLDPRDADVDELARRFLSVRLASWKSDLPRDDKRRRYEGWIAEEVQRVLPHYAAAPDDDGYVSGVGSLEVPIAATVHYLAARMIALEERLEALEKGSSK